MSKIQTGRNLPIATAIGLFLILLVIASLFINKYAFVVLALTALLLAAREIVTQWSKTKNVSASFPLVALSIIGMTVSSVLYGSTGLVISFIGSIFINLLYSYIARKQSSFKSIFGISLFAFSYLGIFGSLAMLMLRPEDGAGRVFLFIAITALSDTGGYLTGILIGKHRIAPNISPKKSKFVDIQFSEGILIGFVLAISGTVGDLFESSIKRKLGIKDFSSLIPGHGGMFDRLDSLAPNALMSFLLFGLFLGFN